MPGACRQGDVCTGHGCFPSRPNSSWSANLFINGLLSHRQGDSWQVHCCLVVCHGGVLASGSSNTFVNGKQQGRIGDPVSCGSSVATGSSNTIIGG